MKKNYPVTGKEHRYRPDQELISSTDLKGIITYANDDFCEIAKFKADELVGINHNVVRHPDMPPPAFEDLWVRVKDGQSWMGLVKNRCKDGDHYWVDAHVTPIFGEKGIIGYESVRVSPERQLVNRAERIYQRIWKGRISFARRFYHSMRARVLLSVLAGFVPVLAGLTLTTSNAAQMGLVLLGLVVAGGLSMLTLAPLTRLSAEARKVVDNPINERVYEGRMDEAAQAMVALRMQTANQRTILRRTAATTDQVESSAQKAQQSVRDTVDAVFSQHEQINQVVAAIEQMTASFNQVSETTHQAADYAQMTDQAVGEGSDTLKRTTGSIHNLVEEIRQIADAITRLEQDVDRIGSIVDVIRGIAEQTNLLALNAAIEAARAGEAGRGFAVVAEEVRALASRTQDATSEINTKIEQLKEGTNKAVTVMHQTGKSTDDSLEQVGSLDEILAKIADQVGQIRDQNNQIAQTLAQELQSAESVNENMHGILDTAIRTEKTATQTQEITDELRKVADDQEALVQGFDRLNRS